MENGNTSSKNKDIELVETINENIKIYKERKKVIDKRFGIIGEPICPKYYFADAKGDKISDCYYSIEPMDNENHYIVSNLDFMYTLDLESYSEIYGDDDYFKSHFCKFHYGVVSIFDNKVTEVVPIVYKRICESNDKVILVYSDEEYDNFNKLKSKGKLGCINLDPDSQYYGWNIAPAIFDHLENFKDGYAYASIKNEKEEFGGYLCKNIDIDRYNACLALYAQAINKNIKMSEYYALLKQALSYLFIKEEDLPKFLTSLDDDYDDEITTDKSYKKI